MDAKNIYIAIRHAANKAQWIHSGQNEWSYVGEKKDFDQEKAQNEIDSFFSEAKLYFSVDRHIGHEVEREKAAWNIHKFIERGGFLASLDFRKVMVFSNIGTYKCGNIAS